VPAMLHSFGVSPTFGVSLSLTVALFHSHKASLIAIDVAWGAQKKPARISQANGGCSSINNRARSSCQRCCSWFHRGISSNLLEVCNFANSCFSINDGALVVPAMLHSFGVSPTFGVSLLPTVEALLTSERRDVSSTLLGVRRGQMTCSDFAGR